MTNLFDLWVVAVESLCFVLLQKRKVMTTTKKMNHLYSEEEDGLLSMFVEENADEEGGRLGAAEFVPLCNLLPGRSVASLRDRYYNVIHPMRTEPVVTRAHKSKSLSQKQSQSQEQSQEQRQEQSEQTWSNFAVVFLRVATLTRRQISEGISNGPSKP